MAHPLSGADPLTLARAFRAGGMPDRWGRAAGICAAVLARAPLSALEALVARPPALADMPPPVFILGHWRSGTTHLYNAMALGGFGFPAPVDVGLPWDMLGLGRVLRPLLDRALPEGRWIDRVPVTPTSPQEDEIAIASMTPLSFYHGIYFPRRFDALIDRGLFFDGCTPHEIAGWERRFTLFLRKLARATGRPLLIKNPVYTGRVARLRRLLPGAKFVHIHRDPVDVFLSMRNFYAKLLPPLALQRAAPPDIDATILRVWRRMMTAYDAETAGLGAPELVEIGYPALEADPVAALRRIYAELELGGFDAALPRFEGYFDAVRDYRKNAFAPDPAAVAMVEAACGPWIDRWGYGRRGRAA